MTNTIERAIGTNLAFTLIPFCSRNA